MADRDDVAPDDVAPDDVAPDDLAPDDEVYDSEAWDDPERREVPLRQPLEPYVPIRGYASTHPDVTTPLGEPSRPEPLVESLADTEVETAPPVDAVAWDADPADGLDPVDPVDHVDPFASEGAVDDVEPASSLELHEASPTLIDTAAGEFASQTPTDDHPPRGLVLFAVVLLGLGAGYLAATLIGGRDTWFASLSWLAAGSALLVGALLMVWVVRPRARRWTSGALAACAWICTVVTALTLGLASILAQGPLNAPGVSAGNAFLAAVTFWFGAWLVSRLDLHGVERQIASRSTGLDSLPARLAAVEARLDGTDERLDAVGQRLDVTAEQHEALIAAFADWERLSQQRAEASPVPTSRERSRSLFRRDR